jgi:hypothetical protein
MGHDATGVVDDRVGDDGPAELRQPGGEKSTVTPT